MFLNVFIISSLGAEHDSGCHPSVDGDFGSFDIHNHTTAVEADRGYMRARGETQPFEVSSDLFASSNTDDHALLPGLRK